ncbi:hypothetical protein [Streptomyces anulatus]|uniref:hypothetical protein n=2 Tax=Streptomyces anulatus TaxID=1892 RepID=UPI0012FF4FBA|nr:hypothetical protein [Streptomyces anulatus]
MRDAHDDHMHGAGGPGCRRAQPLPRGGDGVLGPLPHPGVPHRLQGLRAARVVPVEQEPVARAVPLDEVSDSHPGHHLQRRGEYLAEGVGSLGDRSVRQVGRGGGGVMGDDPRAPGQ